MIPSGPDDLSAKLPASPQSDDAGPMESTAVRRVVFITVVLATAIVTFFASATQHYDAVLAQVSTLDEAQGLKDPRLLALATKIAFVLAAVVNAAVLALYLSLGAIVDQRVVASLRRRLRGFGPVGPGIVVAILATLPPSLVGLIANVPAPKSSPAVIVYIAVVAVVTGVVFLRARVKTLSTSRHVLVIVLLVALGGLSLIF